MASMTCENLLPENILVHVIEIPIGICTLAFVHRRPSSAQSAYSWHGLYCEVDIPS